MSLNKRSARELGDYLLKLPQPTLYPQITYIPFTTKITHHLQKNLRVSHLLPHRAQLKVQDLVI